MAGDTWRAVEQPEGDYRLVGDALPDDIDSTDTYSAAEVTRLAREHGADLRWVAAEGADRGVRPQGPQAPQAPRAPGAPSDDPWGGPLPPA